MRRALTSPGRSQFFILTSHPKPTTHDNIMTEPTLLLQEEIESLLSKCKTPSSSTSTTTTTRVLHSTSSLILTASDLYKIGHVLHELRRRHEQTAFHSVRQACDSLLEVLSPPSYRNSLFATLKQALLSVLQMDGDDDNDDDNLAKKRDALNSVAELYQASEWATRATDWTLEDLSILLSQPSHSTGTVLAIVSHWLLLHPTKNVDWEGLLLPALHLVQSSDRWNEVLEWTNDHQPGWKSILLHHYPEHIDYLQSILEQGNTDEDNNDATNLLRQAIVENDNKLHKSSRRTSQQHRLTAASTTTPVQELERRIDQVRQIFPDLGEGYIELLLSYYKGNVEPTVTALAQDNLPLQLRHLDPSLPRRRRQDSGRDSDNDDDEEARMLAKAALQAAARQEEEEAYMVDMVMRQGAHDEYNDDYDDQYDDTEGFAVPDNTSYDVVHTYNRVLKQVVEDQQFWQDNRNTNKKFPVQQKKKDKTKEEGKAYRGPDKLKGGRILQSDARGGGGGGRGRGGRGRGGRGTPKPNSSSANAKDPSSKSDQQKQQQGGEAGNGQKGNTRAKERKMANRRDRQRKAAAKRTG